MAHPCPCLSNFAWGVANQQRNSQSESTIYSLSRIWSWSPWGEFSGVKRVSASHDVFLALEEVLLPVGPILLVRVEAVLLEEVGAAAARVPRTVAVAAARGTASGGGGKFVRLPVRLLISCLTLCQQLTFTRWLCNLGFAFCPYLKPFLHEHVLCLARGHLRIGDWRLIVITAKELRIGRVSA